MVGHERGILRAFGFGAFRPVMILRKPDLDRVDFCGEYGNVSPHLFFPFFLKESCHER